MPRARCTFRQTEIRRAIKGVELAGLKVTAVEIKQDGSILVRTAPEEPVEETAGGETLGEMIERLSKEPRLPARNRRR